MKKSKVGLGNVYNTYPCCDLILYIVLDFGYCYIVKWHECCLLLFKKAAEKQCNFPNLPDSATCSNACLTHLVTISTIMMIVYQKSYCVRILSKYQ